MREYLMNVAPWFDLLCLLIVATGAILHLNETQRHPWCLRVGYACTFGGALGVALNWWWPLGYEFFADVILHAGLALVVIGHYRGSLRAALSKTGSFIVDRRYHQEPTTYERRKGLR